MTERMKFLQSLKSGGFAVTNEPHSGHITDRHSSTGGRLEKNRKKNAMKRSRADHENLIQEKFPSHFMPNVPRQVHADGGEVNPRISFLQKMNGYAPGGSVGDDSTPPSVGHNNPPSERDLNAFGLYSKAAEVANAAVGQNETMTGKQWKNYLSARGVKPDEFKWSWYNQAFDDDQKYHKSDIAGHFNYMNTEPYKETLYSDEGNKYKLNDEGYGEIAKDIARHPAFAQAFLGKINAEEFAKETEGKSISEKVDHLIDEYEPLLRSAIEERQQNKPTKYADHQMEGDAKNYRELILQHDPDNEKFSYSGHFPDTNPLLHIRMSDRIGPNGEKLLHIEEMQSDWGQQGRRAGFNEEDKKDREKKWKAANNALNDFDYAMRNKYRQQYEKSSITPEHVERIVDRSPLSDLLRHDGTPEERDQYSELLREERKHHRNFKDPIVEEGPHIGETDKWVDLGLKRILKEAADGGYDGITFAPGDQQASRWANKGLKKPYDETIPHRMQRLLKKIDPQLKFGSYSFDLPVWKDEQSGAFSTQKVHHVPLNETHHAEIKKGFERMKRGGTVEGETEQGLFSMPSMFIPQDPPMTISGDLLMGATQPMAHYLSSAMTEQMKGSQQPPPPQPKQTVRQNFNQAFADARKSGKDVFEWKNPITGKVGLYTTELKATGGQVKSSVSKNTKLLHTSPAVEIALSKVGSLSPDVISLIKGDTRGRS